ncbi:MAG: HAMP domain-containing histidine kinase [Lachnospiraceae bacterium]|nr:HAMP domain-containing histidine kinase [Lachnospiraceae bacterium]
MLYGVIVLLAILVLLLTLKLVLLKREMRGIVKDMKANEDGRNLSMDLIDGELQSMVLEVNRLYDDVMKVRAEGRENEERIRESVSMISHDMRTPLTSIIGYLQIAEKTNDRAETEGNVAIALERARYLNKLVNDFFELSLIDSDRVDVRMEKVNLSEIICEEILAETTEIDSRGIEPEFAQSEQNHYVLADREKLVRIVQNLISNAVKYSEKRLEFRIDEKEDGNVSLSILTDPGEKVDTDRIFERFVKADSARSDGGAGLGLYICKRFAEKMGGTISARQSEESFEITLTLKNFE